MVSHIIEGLPLVIRILLTRKPSNPADRQLVFIHITVYGIVHDTLYNDSLAEGSQMN